MNAAYLLIALLIGFFLGGVFYAWARGLYAPPPTPPRPEPRAPRTVVETIKPTIRHVVATTWGMAWQRARGRPLKGAELEAVLEAGEGEIERHTGILGDIVGRAYVGALTDVRRAVREQTGVDAAIIDQAIVIALQRDAQERAEKEERES